jgi:ABC-type nitrate/sulfonate/bicarbonate transport system permease component
MAVMRTLGAVVLRSLSIAALLAVWELCARAHIVSDYLLPSFSAAAVRLYHDIASGDAVLGIGLTLYRAFVGYALAAVAGVAIGILIARVAVMRWFFDPLVSIGLPMPKIAFLPIFMLWFGVFDESKILMVAFSAVFPVIVAAAAAAEGVDRTLLWSAQSLGAGRQALLWEIVLRAALPQVFTGLQVAMPIALIVAIIAEMQMGGEGLGGSMMQSYRFADSPGVFAGILAIAIVGVALVRGMEWLRRWLLVWHPEAEAG